MERLTDLRFIIGLFFSIIGVVLIATALALPSLIPLGKELNLYSGGAMAVFGVFMVVSSLQKPIE